MRTRSAIDLITMVYQNLEMQQESLMQASVRAYNQRTKKYSQNQPQISPKSYSSSPMNKNTSIQHNDEDETEDEDVDDEKGQMTKEQRGKIIF